MICGVDGCRGGWFVLTKDLDTARVTWRIYNTLRELVTDQPLPAVIAVDIPIGLPDRGSRECDRLARQVLGRGRGSSVFPAPVRPVLAARSYPEACQLRFQLEKKKLSRQAWGIVPKVAEVDELLRSRPGLGETIREAHPEVSFSFLSGGKPVGASKKTAQGRQERRALLEPLYGPAVPAAIADRDRSRCVEDDVLDAFAELWTAERIAAGSAITIPAAPPTDRYGLRMEINV